ncbi:MAG TPA: SRPBCC family protein [Nitrospira sp.]|nr:SRPBCC family protein [Nitrospira sp.]
MEPNIGEGQRLLSVLTGLGFIARGLTRPSTLGVIFGMMGISLVYRGASGYCPVSEAIAIDTAGGPRRITAGKASTIRQAIVINRPPADLYRFWRSFANLPCIMSHLQSVFVINDRLSYWVGHTSEGGTVEWGAEITKDIENARIDWHSLADADIDHTGSVEFEPSADGQRTTLTLTLDYAVPGSLSGAAVATIFGEDPDERIAQDLQRFRDQMEGGACG